MKRLLLIFITPLSIIGCGPQSDKQVDQEEPKEIKEEGLPVYNIDPETFIPREFGIMDLVNDDLEIVPLETCLDCIISYPNPSHLLVEDEFILVGSIPPGMKPGELLLFSKDGDYKYKFGKGGRGPGEHVGWSPRKVRYNKEDNTVMVYWGGGQSSIQLFDLNGEFKDQIDLPYNELISSVERLSDSLWFATGYDDWGGFIFGDLRPGDSIRFVLFTQKGDIIKEIHRTNYPSLSKLQEKLFSPWTRPYKYDGTGSSI